MRVLYYLPGLLMCVCAVHDSLCKCKCMSVSLYFCMSMSMSIAVLFAFLWMLFEKCVYVSCVFFGRRLLNVYLQNCLFLPFGYPCSLFLSFGFSLVLHRFCVCVNSFIHSFRFFYHIETILFDELLTDAQHIAHIYIFITFCIVTNVKYTNCRR